MRYKAATVLLGFIICCATTVLATMSASWYPDTVLSIKTLFLAFLSDHNFLGLRFWLFLIKWFAVSKIESADR